MTSRGKPVPRRSGRRSPRGDHPVIVPPAESTNATVPSLISRSMRRPPTPGIPALLPRAYDQEVTLYAGERQLVGLGQPESAWSSIQRHEPPLQLLRSSTTQSVPTSWAPVRNRSPRGSCHSTGSFSQHQSADQMTSWTRSQLYDVHPPFDTMLRYLSGRIQAAPIPASCRSRERSLAVLREIYARREPSSTILIIR
jgi:hypothetical protein